MKSKLLKLFVDEIQFKNRNPLENKALEYLKDLSTNPELLLKKGTKLYRSRIIKKSDYCNINKTPNFFGFNSKDSFVPPKELTRDMRANYRYIPYLYCSNDPYVALVEVRPRIGERVSIATIQVLDDLNVLDLTMLHKPSKMSKPKQRLFDDLSFLFSKPVSDYDDTLDYIPTQYIAEYVKNVLKYDGIIYKSSLLPELDTLSSELYNNYIDKYNIVIFDFTKCKPIKSNVFSVSNITVESKKEDADTEELLVQDYISYSLDKILDIQRDIFGDVR